MRSAIRTQPPMSGAIETATEFGKRLYLEAWNRGWSRALAKVVLGDGAEWIWNIAPGGHRGIKANSAGESHSSIMTRIRPEFRKARRGGSSSGLLR